MDEKFEDLVMECNNCHLQFYAANLWPHPETNLLTCINCFRLPGSKIQVIKDRPLKKAVVRQDPIAVAIKESAKESLVAFECTHCRYQFNRRKGWVGNCPYCNQNSVKMQKKS